jgi:hypothetical protein
MREGDLFSDRGEFLKFDFNAACGYGLGGMTVGCPVFRQNALTADALIVPFRLRPYRSRYACPRECNLARNYVPNAGTDVVMDAKETTRGARHFGGPHLEFTIDLGHVAIDHLLKLNRCRDTPHFHMVFGPLGSAPATNPVKNSSHFRGADHRRTTGALAHDD